jgi:hypothetical protein
LQNKPFNGTNKLALRAQPRYIEENLENNYAKAMGIHAEKWKIGGYSSTNTGGCLSLYRLYWANFSG